MNRLRTVIFAWIVFGAVGVARADSASTSADVLPPEVESLVERLDDSNWRTRDRAMLALMDVSPVWLETLRRRSQSGISTEAELRLRRAAEELYMSRNGVPASACLGIQHTQCIDGRYDSRVAPGVYALRVDIVFPNTAADRAGIRPGDLIIGLNGDIAASEAECNSITPWIATQMPGARCEFTVLRDVVGRTYRPGVERGIDSRGFRDLSTRVVRGADDARLPHDAVALEVTSVRDADPRLDLAVGDLIVALNGKRLPAQDPKGALETWANTRRKTEPDAEDAPIPNIPPAFLPPNARRSLRESIQTLRGGQRITLEVTLGRWPLYIAATRDVRRGVRRERILKLSVEFNQWWREPASADGLTLHPVCPDPAMFWQMEQ